MVMLFLSHEGSPGFSVGSATYCLFIAPGEIDRLQENLLYSWGLNTVRP